MAQAAGSKLIGEKDSSKITFIFILLYSNLTIRAKVPQCSRWLNERQEIC